MSSRLIYAAFSVQLLFACRPLWAMSCEVVFPPESKSNSNVVSFDFGRRQQARSESPEHAPSDSSAQLLSFKSRELPQEFRGDENAVELASVFVEQVSRFQDFVELSAQGSSKMNPTQSNVWTTYRQYLELPGYLKYLSDPNKGLSATRLSEMNAQLESLIQRVDETDLFGHYQRQGFTLVPKPHERIKNALPATALLARQKFIQNFKTNLSLEGLNPEGLLPHIYHKNAEGFVIRAEKYIRDFNQFLSATKSEFDSKSTDLTPLNPLVNALDSLFANPLFEQVSQTAQGSKSPQIVGISQSLEIEINRFKALSFSLKNSAVTNLRLVD